MICLMLLLSAELAFPQQKDISLEIHGEIKEGHATGFFAPHENEHVVNDYLANKIVAEKGIFLILRQRGERHIRLRLDKVVEVDPNRIFTALGVRNSLLKLNPDLKEDSALYKAAHKRAVALGVFILDQMKLPTIGGNIIAIHNNTDGYDDDGKDGVGTISIKRYKKRFEAGARYIKDIHCGDGDEDDLFFITEPSDFEIMKKKGWNVVLQHPQVATIEEEDDGSLSVYAEKKGHRYINIEAQRKPGDDHLKIQKQMVDLVFELVFD